jgi:hypothetical protein
VAEIVVIIYVRLYKNTTITGALTLDPQGGGQEKKCRQGVGIITVVTALLLGMF